MVLIELELVVAQIVQVVQVALVLVEVEVKLIFVLVGVVEMGII